MFHFWGTLWGELLTAVLVAQGVGAEPVNEYCLYLRQPISALPPVDEKAITKAARDIIITLANRLEMGRFHRLLPAAVGTDATLKQLNLERFHALYNQVSLVPKSDIDEQLQLLIQ